MSATPTKSNAPRDKRGARAPKAKVGDERRRKANRKQLAKRIKSLAVAANIAKARQKGGRNEKESVVIE